LFIVVEYQALTIFYALHELRNVQEGQRVLIHSTAGGCGTFALGISKQLKAKIVATVGSNEKIIYFKVLTKPSGVFLLKL
jgi:phthiocerol/phenolphthiocerol synthesis type-I polyketide synthase C